MNLSQVEVFLAIIDAGGFNQAAVRLGCSQPAVSQQLRRLEESLGVQLIGRTRGKPQLTPDGARFRPYARRLIETASRAREALRSDALAVGTSSNIGVYFLHRVVREYVANNPDCAEPKIRIGSNPEVVEQVISGEVDIAVLEWWIPRKGMVAFPWVRERLVLITPPDHALAHNSSIEPDFLFTIPLLGGESGTGTGTLLRNVFGERSNDIRVSQNLGSTEAVKRAVRSGIGVSLVLEGAVADEVRHGYLAAIPISGTRLEKEFQIVLPEDIPPTAPAWRFVDALRTQAKDPGGNGHEPESIRDTSKAQV